MERDPSTGNDYDHARFSATPQGRFMSPDKVGGRAASPSTWNRYTYTLSNPVKHIDPDGLLTILVHGTWGSKTSDLSPGGVFFRHVMATAPDRTFAALRWSGEDSRQARSVAAQKLASYIRSYHFSPGEKLTIIAHSHGGNVAIEAINKGFGHPVDNLITLGTPARGDYQLSDLGVVRNWINVSNESDQFQISGGAPMFFPAGRDQPDAQNIDVDVDLGPIGSHSILHTKIFWNLILPRLQIQPQGSEAD